MANEWDSYNEETQREKVKAGWKGGPFYRNPILHPSMTIVDAVQPEVKAENQASTPAAIPMEDPWYSRRNR